MYKYHTPIILANNISQAKLLEPSSLENDLLTCGESQNCFLKHSIILRIKNGRMIRLSNLVAVYDWMGTPSKKQHYQRHCL